MAWTLGAFTFPSATQEEPIRGTNLRFAGGQQRWSAYDPVGSNKTILTYLGQASQQHSLRALVLEASKNSLKALYDAQTPVTFITPWDVVGVSVLMTRFVARKHHSTADRWQVEITLVER